MFQAQTTLAYPRVESSFLIMASVMTDQGDEFQPESDKPILQPHALFS